MSLTQNASEIVLLHNPRCSKSRATHALLSERGVSFRERLYLEEPLSEDELCDLETRLGRPIAGWIRKGESAYAEAGLSDTSTDAQLRAAIAAHAILMERPIVINGSRARVGRPPEDVLELFE